MARRLDWRKAQNGREYPQPWGRPVGGGEISEKEARDLSEAHDTSPKVKAKKAKRKAKK